MTGRLARAGPVALTVLGALLWAWYLLAVAPSTSPVDAHAYFAASGTAIYGRGVGAPDAYLYSPAFAQAIEPLRWLGADGFVFAWRAAEIAALVWLAGPLAGFLLAIPAAFVEINVGNVHLLTAAAIVVGFRWPASWAFVLLTKVTPGIGLVWFAARREWRSLGIALGATCLVAAVSFAVAPSLWFEWLRLLATADATHANAPAVIVALPLWPRLVLAAVLVAYGARRDWRWTVPVAAFLAMPVLWVTSATVLVALLARGLIRTGTLRWSMCTRTELVSPRPMGARRAGSPRHRAAW